ncbi:hypothetical protein [Endozoicomonas lisbonensis]|uniref:Uncharacterized protein n=1 Tax=Endozoicomonas lisbonensis TaxID=3120522 RepID=A0ABV2SFG0_9GAMM
MDPMSSSAGSPLQGAGFQREKTDVESKGNEALKYLPPSDAQDKPEQKELAFRSTGLSEESTSSGPYKALAQYDAEKIIGVWTQFFKSSQIERIKMQKLVNEAVSEGKLTMEELMQKISEVPIASGIQASKLQLIREKTSKEHLDLLKAQPAPPEKSSGDSSGEVAQDLPDVGKIQLNVPLTGYLKEIDELKGWVEKLKAMGRQHPGYRPLLNKVNEKIGQLTDLGRNIRLDVGPYKTIITEVSTILESAHNTDVFFDLRKNLESGVSIGDLSREFSYDSWIADNVSVFSKKVKKAMLESGLSLQSISIRNHVDPHHRNKGRPMLILNYREGFQTSYLYYPFTEVSPDGSAVMLSRSHTEDDHLFDMGAISERKFFNRHSAYRVFTETAIHPDNFRQSALTLSLYDNNNQLVSRVSTQTGELNVLDFYEETGNHKTKHVAWHSFLRQMVSDFVSYGQGSYYYGPASVAGDVPSHITFRSAGLSRGAPSAFRGGFFDARGATSDPFTPYAELYEKAEEENSDSE